MNDKNKSTWTPEDAAIAADAAMDRGAFGAELWRYYPPEFVYCLSGYPELLAEVIGAHQVIRTPLSKQLNRHTRRWRIKTNVHIGRRNTFIDALSALARELGGILLSQVPNSRDPYYWSMLCRP